MIFSSLQYLIFLPIVVLLYWRTKGGARLALVVLASYFFYMSWFPVYGALLLFLTAANWQLARWLSPSKDDDRDDYVAPVYDVAAHNHKHGAAAIQGTRPQPTLRRKLLLTAGLLLNFGCLCYYKYTNFLLANLFDLLNFAHSSSAKLLGNTTQIAAMHSPVLNVILPLGISFFVFEFVHYIVDVYYGSKPVRSFMKFAAFASFFPSQIAGPIKRYQDFMARLRTPEAWSTPLFFEAMTLILQGLFKKVAIADPIGVLISGPFSHPHTLSSADALIAMVGFVIQVYCDFSGYTDIGRGSALLLGIRLPENFNLPYLSRDLNDFWRRWHMSLGYWLRDYVYIPLGGSRTGRFVNWRNLFITMVACGLWHGASWHYAVFGATQGLGLIANREWRNLLKANRSLQAVFETTAGKLFSTFLTLAFVIVTFSIFRAPNLPHEEHLLQALISCSGNCVLWGVLMRSSTLQLLAIYFSFWLVNELAKRKPLWFGPLVNTAQTAALQFATPVRLAAWTAAVILTIAARPTEAVPFVYFQF